MCNNSIHYNSSLSLSVKPWNTTGQTSLVGCFPLFHFPGKKENNRELRPIILCNAEYEERQLGLKRAVGFLPILYITYIAFLPSRQLKARTYPGRRHST